MIKFLTALLAVSALIPMQGHSQETIQIYKEFGSGGLSIGGLFFENQDFNGVGGNIMGMEALLRGSTVGIGDKSYNNIHNNIYRAAGRGSLNVIMASNLENADLGTSSSAHVRGGIGYDVHKRREGSGVYFGIGGSMTGGAFFNQELDGYYNHFIGPETGLRIATEEAVIVLTPSVGWGYAMLNSGSVSNLKVSASNWAFGGRFVAGLKAVEIYGDFFRIANSARDRYSRSGRGGNAEIRVEISDRLSLLGYWEFVRVAQDLGLKITDEEGREVRVPSVVTEAERNKLSAAVEWKIGGE